MPKQDYINGFGITLSYAGIGFEASGSWSKGNIIQNGVTWTESTVTARDTLTIESGKDTSIIGGQAFGDTVKASVGNNLNIESLQDTDNYKEKNTGASIGISTAPNSKPSISGGASNQNINSNYSSVQEQSGIFARTGGFDITVGGNTDLKGGVIASDATADKNKLSTDTLTYSDINNHADYKANTTGANINHSFDNGKQAGDAVDARTFDDEVKKNDKGLTPNMAGSKGSADSTTKAAIDPGTIEIRSDAGKDETDTSGLSRDTASANNPLNPIFDKDKILEKQEAAKVFGEIGFKLIGDIAERAGWKEGSPEKIALHALVGGIMAEINGGKFGEGLSTAAINELLIAELIRIPKKDKDGNIIKDINGNVVGLLSSAELRLISAALGMAINGTQGSEIADSATRNNASGHMFSFAGSYLLWGGDLTLIAMKDDVQGETHFFTAFSAGGGLNILPADITYGYIWTAHGNLDAQDTIDYVSGWGSSLGGGFFLGAGKMVSDAYWKYTGEKAVMYYVGAHTNLSFGATRGYTKYLGSGKDGWNAFLNSFGRSLNTEQLNTITGKI